MKLRRATVRGFRLPLVRPLATAHGVIAERCGLLVQLEDAHGRIGTGEATPLSEFGTESFSECENALEEGLSAWMRAGDRSSDGDGSIGGWDPPAKAPTARAALECAIADLAAQSEGVSLADHWRRSADLSGEPARSVAVQALVVGSTPEAVADSAKRARASGYRTFKLKVASAGGATGLEIDEARVAALRDSVGPDARIRLDANEGWSRAESRTALGRLAEFDIDYVEQPVKRHDLEGLAALDAAGPIRIAADEALLGGGLERCLERRVAGVLVLKPAALGGFRMAIDVVQHAKRLGLGVVWSSLLDGCVSRAAALHLAAALSDAASDGGHDAAHGLATGELLAADLGVFPRVVDGRLTLSSGPGLGFASDSFRESRAAAQTEDIWDGPAKLIGGFG